MNNNNIFSAISIIYYYHYTRCMIVNVKTVCIPQKYNAEALQCRKQWWLRLLRCPRKRTPIPMPLDRWNRSLHQTVRQSPRALQNKSIGYLIYLLYACCTQPKRWEGRVTEQPKQREREKWWELLIYGSEMEWVFVLCKYRNPPDCWLMWFPAIATRTYSQRRLPFRWEIQLRANIDSLFRNEKW